jgi:hypothetical protein
LTAAADIVAPLHHRNLPTTQTILKPFHLPPHLTIESQWLHPQAHGIPVKIKHTHNQPNQYFPSQVLWTIWTIFKCSSLVQAWAELVPTP